MAKRPRIAVLTTEPPPLAGLATTGAGLRAWALAQGLLSAGHDDVTVAIAADAFVAQGKTVPPTPKGAPAVESVERAHLSEWIRDRSPDVVVAQHWGLLERAREIRCPLAIDLAGPHLLERQLWGSRDPEGDRREKLEMLSRADFVVCSGRSQRAYFLPYLFGAGFTPQPDLCPVIPFSMPPDLPTPAKDRDYSAFVFSGFFLPWQDPEKPLRWLLEEFEQRGKGRLEFFGGAHPTLDVSRGQFDSLAALIENHPRVVRHGVVPFDELVLTLRKCGVALDLMPRNLERELAFPSRTVVYLWAGVPAVHNNYDDVAPLIDKYRAGWTVDPDDEKEFRKAVGRLVEHWEDVERRSQGAQELVRTELTWDKTIGPLSRWTLDPHPRPGRVPAAAPRARTAVGKSPRTPEAPAEDLRQAREEIERLRGELELVRSRKVVQIARRARELSPLLAPLAYLLALAIGIVLFILFIIADAVAALTGRRPSFPSHLKRGSRRKRRAVPGP